MPRKPLEALEGIYARGSAGDGFYHPRRLPPGEGGVWGEAPGFVKRIVLRTTSRAWTGVAHTVRQRGSQAKRRCDQARGDLGGDCPTRHLHARSYDEHMCGLMRTGYACPACALQRYANQNRRYVGHDTQECKAPLATTAHTARRRCATPCARIRSIRRWRAPTPPTSPLFAHDPRSTQDGAAQPNAAHVAAPYDPGQTRHRCEFELIAAGMSSESCERAPTFFHRCTGTDRQPPIWVGQFS